ncbi:MAG: VWA domain-containing protein [Albidovulum sp.]|nr:VWA domain-containing protein [Albidovulum sp.]
MEIKLIPILEEKEFVENPTTRLPICLVLDTSASMKGAPINELQEGVDLFFSELLNDEVAKFSAEVAVITFGGGVEVKSDFAAVSSRQEPPRLNASGWTPMGEAVEVALEKLEARKEKYKRVGVDYFQPWLVLMTDGVPTDDILRASGLVGNLSRQKKLAVFAVGIGKDADLKELGKLSGGRAPLKLKGLAFGKFFLWLSASVSQVSNSVPGNETPLNPVDSWARV